ncbi:MAG TPA: hypothetical protein VMA54_08905 [Steroidobacteraceae bacterium]|nr:hypothetical protein [Steroidobacteraceae bacterium]
MSALPTTSGNGTKRRWRERTDRSAVEGKAAMLRAQSGHRPYARLHEIITDGAHPEHRETLTWCGGRFDAEVFNLGRTNRDIKATLSSEPPHPLPGVTGHANCCPPVIKIVVAHRCL